MDNNPSCNYQNWSTGYQDRATLDIKWRVEKIEWWVEKIEWRINQNILGKIQRTRPNN